jgi:exodeoxyribonuclease VII large subunit
MDESQGEFDFSTRQKVWSVGEFTRQVRGILESTFDSLQVRGQIGNITRAQSGHIYMNLVDDEDGGKSRISSSQLRVVMWRGQAARLRFEPETGMKVVVSGKITVYEPKGEYQLVAARLEPEGVGELQLAFEQLKAKLQDEGLFDIERKTELPFFPERIGLVTSSSGAAVRDFLRTLYSRNGQAQVRLVPVRVQGEGAALEVARAIELLQRDDAGVDAIVLTRGGGSLEDLWAFNEEVVARAIAASGIPVVSAIGHEVDFTIADFVADERAATPTAAASLVSPDRGELLRRLDANQRRLALGLRSWADRGESELARCRASRYLSDPQLVVEERLEHLDRVLGDLRLLAAGRLDEMEHRLSLLGARLETLSPYAVLKRGYAVALDAAGEVVSDAEDLSVGDLLRLRLDQGEAGVKVEELG